METIAKSPLVLTLCSTAKVWHMMSPDPVCVCVRACVRACVLPCSRSAGRLFEWESPCQPDVCWVLFPEALTGKDARARCLSLGLAAGKRFMKTD